MSTSGKSDWTPEAYRLREEFRKRRELSEDSNIHTYKSMPKKYDVLESEWTLTAYENREKTRKARESIDLNAKNHSTQKIESLEKRVDNTVELNNVSNPRKLDDPILDKTATPHKGAVISDQRIAHVKFTNQPVNPVIRNNQRQATSPEKLNEKSLLEKSSLPDRPVKIHKLNKRKRISDSDIRQSNGYFRFISTILIAGTVGFMLGIITFSKSPNTKTYPNGVKSRPIMNK